MLNETFFCRDEPTVGIDPVVRQDIWNLLNELVSKNDQTVLITTHCWSEATQASTLGFMRNGQILLEQSTSGLFDDYSTSDIEHIFYHLCSNSTEEEDRNLEFAVSKGQPPIIEATQRNDKDVFDWHAFKALLLKDSIHARRHASFLAFQVVLPIFVTLLFYACIGRSMYYCRKAFDPGPKGWGSEVFLLLFCSPKMSHLRFGIFHQFLSCLVTLFDQKLQVFKNSPKLTIFCIFGIFHQFCPIKSDLSGSTVSPQTCSKVDHFWLF